MDQLSAEAITATLKTNRLGRTVLYYEQTDSTNDEALRLAASGAQDGLLVIADRQSAGRGRLDRTWWSPAGSSLLFSLLVRPLVAARRAGQLTMCLGLGAVEGIAQVTGLAARLKWPNDLVVGEHKLAGMLAELRLAGEQVEYAVLGLGLNVNVSFEANEQTSAEHSPSAPPELANIATSLLMELGHPVERLTLLCAILERCEYWYMHLLAGESPHAEWSRHLDTLGKRVRVTLPVGVVEGVATGATAEGALLLQQDDGRLAQIWAGDVSSVRGAS